MRPKVLSHVSRQRVSPHGTPLPLIGSRRDRFPDVTGPIEVLRLPATHIRSLICFASGVHAILLASCLATLRSRKVGEPSGPGSLFTRRPDLPVCLHVDVTGPPRFPGDPSRAFAPLSDPGRTDDPSPLDGVVDVAPALPTAKASAVMNFGAQSRGFGTRCLRFKNGVATVTCKARFRPAGLAFTGRASNPLDRYKRFSVRLILLFWT